MLLPFVVLMLDECFLRIDITRGLFSISMQRKLTEIDCSHRLVTRRFKLGWKRKAPFILHQLGCALTTLKSVLL
jgi:hypothetical protein